MQSADQAPQFQVSLENFTGPFELLLSLISRRELDLTQVALSEVTDEFLAFTASLSASAPEAPITPDPTPAADSSGAGPAADPGADAHQVQERLERISGFVVVAAALLEIKASLLLPQESGVDPQKLRALEEQDLLFSRLLQYRALQEAAAYLSDRLLDPASDLLHPPSPLPRKQEPSASAEGGSGQEPDELQVSHLWALATQVLARASQADEASESAQNQKQELAQRAVAHLHADRYSVEDESARILTLLEHDGGRAAFEQIIAGCAHRLQMVVRFLSLLELFRQERIELSQPASGETITVCLIRNTVNQSPVNQTGSRSSEGEQ